MELRTDEPALTGNANAPRRETDAGLDRLTDEAAVRFLQVSFDRLSASAQRLLERLAWLGPEPVPESLLDVTGQERKTTGAGFLRRLLSRLGSQDPVKDPRVALAELASHSLVTHATRAPTFTVHPLAQDMTRHRLRRQRRLESLIETLRWVNDAFAGNPQDARTWPTLEPLAPHARAVATFADAVGPSAAAARLMNQLGQLFVAQSLFAEAEPLMERAVKIFESCLGEQHPNVATALNNLAQLLQATNRYAEAEPLRRRALVILLVSSLNNGYEHPHLQAAFGNYRGLLQAMGKSNAEIEAAIESLRLGGETQ